VVEAAEETPPPAPQARGPPAKPQRRRDLPPMEPVSQKAHAAFLDAHEDTSLMTGTDARGPQLPLRTTPTSTFGRQKWRA